MMDKSLWSVVPLGAVDMDDSSSDRMGARRTCSEDNLFEILPKFLITPAAVSNIEIGEENDDQVDEVCFAKLMPKFICATSIGGDTIGIVLDSELLILEKVSELEVKYKVSFSSSIDFVLWRRSILLVGLSSSEVVLVDPRTYEIKESKKLCMKPLPPTNDRFFIDAAFHSNPDPTKIDVTVIGKSGMVYLFNNIALSDGALDSTQDQNMSVDVDVGSIRGKIKHCLENANVVCASSPGRNIIILGEHNGTISMHDIEETEETKALKISHSLNIVKDLGLTHETQHVSLKKIVPFEGLLFILLTNGELEILLDDVLFATDKFKLPEDSFIVHDFALVLTTESEVKLWVIYGDIDSSLGQNFIGIFGGPSFLMQEFTAKIPRAKDQIQNMSSRVQYLFPSKFTPKEEPFTFLEISSIGIKIYHMSETSTDSTIQKLLSQGKFDQAAALAMQYSRDLDIVFKAKARAKFNELLGSAHIKNPDRAENTFSIMIDALEKVNDAQFVCIFCTQRGLPKLNWIKSLLSVGKLKVKDCGGTEGAKNYLLILKKFFTFEQVFPNASIQDWTEFESDENTMFQQCVWFLKKEEFDKCERVWKRHFDEFIPNITLSEFGPFFLILFGKKLSTLDAISLFKCILPYAVEKCAENNQSLSSFSASVELNEQQLSRVSILVDIVKRQICSLEREINWPIGAIEFSKTVINTVKNESENLKNLRNKHEEKIITQSFICNEILKRMEILLQNLIELGNLKQDHSIRIPFQEYIDDNVFDVVNSMLYELFLRDEIERFVNKFLIPFATRKNIEVDKLFHEHVKSVVSDLPFHINSIDIPHEERIICLVNFITSHERKLRSIYKVAEEWPVPWSNNIDDLVVTCLRIHLQGDSVCKELQKKINIMRIQVPFRCLLNKYRLSAPKVQTACGVTMALTRIIKTGKPNEYFKDCLELIKHTGRADEDKIQFLEFNLKLQNCEYSLEDLLSPKMKTRLLKRLTVRTLQEFRTDELFMFTKEESDRLINVCKILANINDDKKVLEFLKLREVMPGLINSDVVYDEKYPFCLLSNIMTESTDKPSHTVVQQCKMLSDITLTPLSDILVAAAAYYARPNGFANDLIKAWDIIEEIVNSPRKSFGQSGNPISRELVQSAALKISQFLICNCPDSTEFQLGILHEFIVLMASFDGNENTEDMAKMLNSYRVFWGLREQEIPLEKEFVAIYKWIYLEPGSIEQFFKLLSNFGSTVLKFGDKDLFKQAFGFIQKEFKSRTMQLFGSKEHNNGLTKFAIKIKTLEKDLLDSYEKTEEIETDKNVLELVEILKKEATLCMTPYALRKRNKSRLLEKLLGMNQYCLAAQVALVFGFYSDYKAWSNILKGFMNSGDIKELRKVLTDLRNVSELWMLSEFAEGWRKVSEVDPGFLDLCPIPLD